MYDNVCQTLSSFLSKLAAFPFKASWKLSVSSPYGICSISSFTSILDQYFLKHMLIVLLWLMWTTLWSALIYIVNFDNNQALIIHDIFRAREEIHHTSLHLSWEERRVACERSLAACRAVATPVTSTHSISYHIPWAMDPSANPSIFSRMWMIFPTWCFLSQFSLYISLNMFESVPSVWKYFVCLRFSRAISAVPVQCVEERRRRQTNAKKSEATHRQAGVISCDCNQQCVIGRWLMESTENK